MKTFILGITLAAFALIPAVQAGEGGCCPATKDAQVCPMSKQAAGKSCPKAAAAAKAKAKTPATSEKGASDLVKK